MAEGIERKRVLVSGIVQGVFFRGGAADVARRLGVSGWVRNLPDGRVEAAFEGAPFQVEQAVEWMSHGPSSAVVEHVEIVDEEPEGESGFRVEH